MPTTTVATSLIENKIEANVSWKYFVAGRNLLHVVSFEDPTTLRILDRKEFEGNGRVNDVTVCPGFVAVTYNNYTSPMDGSVNIYRSYKSEQGMEMIHNIRG